MELLYYALIGILMGFISGGAGVGGGVIAVPALTILLGLNIKHSMAISLAAIVPIALVGALNHYRLGNMQAPSISLPILLIVFGAAGAILGTTVAHHLPAVTLKRAFGALLLIASIRMMVATAPDQDASKHQPPEVSTTANAQR